MSSGFMAIAPAGHSRAQMPQPLRLVQVDRVGGRGLELDGRVVGAHVKQLSQATQLPHDASAPASASVATRRTGRGAEPADEHRAAILSSEDFWSVVGWWEHIAAGQPPLGVVAYAWTREAGEAAP